MKNLGGWPVVNFPVIVSQAYSYGLTFVGILSRGKVAQAKELLFLFIWSFRGIFSWNWVIQLKRRFCSSGYDRVVRLLRAVERYLRPSKPLY